MRDEDIEQYKEIFDIFDETGDGTISNDEIGKAMQGLGEASTPEKINELIALIDYDGDGEVDFDEFVCLMVKNLVEADKVEEELVDVFNNFDLDNDGKINAMDLINMMRNIGQKTNINEANEMIKFFGNNGSDMRFCDFVKLLMFDSTDIGLVDGDNNEIPE